MMSTYRHILLLVSLVLMNIADPAYAQDARCKTVPLPSNYPRHHQGQENVTIYVDPGFQDKFTGIPFRRAKNRWNNRCSSGAHTPKLNLSFEIRPGNVGPGDAIEVVYFPDRVAMIDDGDVNPAYWNPTHNQIELSGKIQHPGGGEPVEFDWETPLALVDLIHEIGHPLGIWHDDSPSCAAEKSIMLSGDKPRDAKVLDTHCVEIDRQNDPDRTHCPDGGEDCNPTIEDYAGEFDDPRDIENETFGNCDRLQGLLIADGCDPWYWQPDDRFGGGGTEVTVEEGCPPDYEHLCSQKKLVVEFPNGVVLEGPTIGLSEEFPVVNQTLIARGYIHSGHPTRSLLFYVNDQIAHTESDTFPDGRFEAAVNIGGLSAGSHQFSIVVVENRASDALGTKHGATFIKEDNGSSPEPDISVVQSWDSQPIIDGGAYDYGVYVGADLPQSRVMLVCNDGGAPLHLSGPFVQGDAFYNVGEAPQGSISPGICSTFRVRFDPQQLGQHSGQVSFHSNDPDEDPFVYHVTGHLAESNGPDTDPPRLFSNSPRTDDVVANTLNLQGWALDSASVLNIRFELDGIPLEVQSLETDNTNVGACATFPEIDDPRCPNVGYSATFDTRWFTNGLHTLSIHSTDGAGNTGVVDVRVNFQNSVRLIQPGADAFVAQTWPDASFGDRQELRVRVAATQVGRFTFLKLDIPTDIPLSNVSKATLWLKSQETIISDLELYRIDMGNWLESAITWNNWRTQEDPILMGTYYDLAGNSWHSFNVIEAIRNVGSQRIITVGMVSSADLANLDFWSKESEEAPLLVLEF